jgi:uncharacterized protein (TIGR02246 family)
MPQVEEIQMSRVTLTVGVVIGCLALTVGIQAGDQVEEEAVIRQAVESYVAAYNRGDAEALAAMWSPDAVYTNPLTGEQVVGREAIQGQFAGIFADASDVKLSAATDSIDFISPSVAVEHGSAKVTSAGEEVENSTYTAIYVKRDGQWLLDRVTEQDVPGVTSQQEQLGQLEWMIGTWVDESEQDRVETTCKWTKNRNFMTRSFVLSVEGKIDLAGMQIVGWDPLAETIRSWVFDSDGGFGEGIWTKKGDAWYIQVTGNLPDGSQSSSTNIITYVDDDTFTWQSTNRVAGGEILPNVDEVVVVRQTDME